MAKNTSLGLRKKPVRANASAKKRSDYKIDLSKIPDGNRKPYETCDVLDAMRNWRAESAHSTTMIG